MSFLKNEMGFPASFRTEVGSRSKNYDEFRSMPENLKNLLYKF